MAAKTTRHKPDPHDLVALHLQASQQRDELLKQCRELQAAGKLAAARKALNLAEVITAGLLAFEAAVRPPGDQRRDRRFAD